MPLPLSAAARRPSRPCPESAPSTPECSCAAQDPRYRLHLGHATSRDGCARQGRLASRPGRSSGHRPAWTCMCTARRIQRESETRWVPAPAMAMAPVPARPPCVEQSRQHRSADAVPSTSLPPDKVARGLRAPTVRPPGTAASSGGRCMIHAHRPPRRRPRIRARAEGRTGAGGGGGGVLLRSRQDGRAMHADVACCRLHRRPMSFPHVPG